jgi:hypothetical protein
MVALPELGTASWTQRVTLGDMFRATGISLRLATFGASGLHGTVKLSIRTGQDPRVHIASARLSAAKIVDGEMARFVFTPAMSLPSGDYDMSLTYEGAALGEAITVWYTPGHGKNCVLRVEPAMPAGCLIMQWLSDREDLSTWQKVAEDGNLLLMENPDTPRGPYFVQALSTFPHASDTAEVHAVRGPSHGWVLDYKGSGAGFVVLPMNSNNAWRFLRDGRKVQPVKYLGALPAIPVEGPVRIEARYEPLSIRWGRWIAGGSLLAMLVAVCLLARNGRTARRID